MTAIVEGIFVSDTQKNVVGLKRPNTIIMPSSSSCMTVVTEKIKN